MINLTASFHQPEGCVHYVEGITNLLVDVTKLKHGDTVGHCLAREAESWVVYKTLAEILGFQ